MAITDVLSRSSNAPPTAALRYIQSTVESDLRSHISSSATATLERCNRSISKCTERQQSNSLRLLSWKSLGQRKPSRVEVLEQLLLLGLSTRLQEPTPTVLIAQILLIPST